MKLKTLFSVAIIIAIAIGFASCNGKKGEQSTKDVTATSQVIDNKDEMTFLHSFLDKYLTLSGKEAQELAKNHLTDSIL